MKCILFFLLVLAAGCHHTVSNDALSLIQIQDRNGLTETISNPDRLLPYEAVDFFSSQPYKKILRIYRAEGKNHSKITTYHPNGSICQYLEAEEMRAHGAYREWHANGHPKLEATVIGGTADLANGSQSDWLFDSICRVWDEQGNLVAQIAYQKGDLEGESLYFYPSGQIEKQLFFAKNHLEGEVLEFSPDGQLKSKTHYRKGLKNGPCLRFFEDGGTASIEDYTEGYLRTGAYYGPQGEQISEIDNGGGFQALFQDKALTLVEFRIGNPEGLVKKFSPSGELQRTFYVKNGAKQGEEIEYYLASQVEGVSDHPLPKLSIFWNENTVHGCVKTWYNNGKLQSQRDYSKNRKSGPSLAWYRNGAFMLIEEYEEDRLISGQYYKINKAEPVSTVTNGNGLAILYDETGALLQKVTYLKGKPIDPEN